ncbi:hypothetical protein ACRRTK_022557 [Alexandromys fortis]
MHATVTKEPEREMRTTRTLNPRWKIKAQKYRIYILHLSEWLKPKTPMIAFAGEDVEEGVHSSIAGGNANLCNHFGNQCGDSSGNSGSIYPWTQQYHSWEYTQEMPYHMTKASVQLCS